MGKIDLKDKRNVYAIVICLLMMVAAHLVYNYMWDPFTYQREALERDLQSAPAELDKINAKKHRVAELEMQLVQAEKDFEKLKEMFPEEEKVPLRLQDLYAVIRSSMVQIQKFNPEGRAEKDQNLSEPELIAELPADLGGFFRRDPLDRRQHFRTVFQNGKRVLAETLDDASSAFRPDPLDRPGGEITQDRVV